MHLYDAWKPYKKLPLTDIVMDSSFYFKTILNLVNQT
jgi:hypothetical protein